MFGDIDGDGLMDVIGVDNNGCKIYRNDNGTFYHYRTISGINSILDNNSARRYKLHDMDGDGKVELIVLDKNNNGLITIVSNLFDISGGVSTYIFYLPFITAEHCLFGDLNNDGLANIVVMAENVTNVYYARGTYYNNSANVTYNSTTLYVNSGTL
jgi:hypothetical protein